MKSAETHFQKSVIKVMAILLTFQASVFFVSWLAEHEAKPQKEFIYKTIIGNDFVEFVKTQAEKKHTINKEVINNDPELQKAQRKIKLISISAIVVAIGILYLFSCLIVRILNKTNINEKTNQALKLDD